jgi:hypothetical protein
MRAKNTDSQIEMGARAQGDAVASPALHSSVPSKPSTVLVYVLLVCFLFNEEFLESVKISTERGLQHFLSSNVREIDTKDTGTTAITARRNC